MYFRHGAVAGVSPMQKSANPPSIVTERLRLRGHRAEDLPACAAMWAEAGVTRFVGGKPLTEEETWLRMLRHIGHWALLSYGYWVVEEMATGAFLGEAGLAEFHRQIEPTIVGTPEAGWVFATASHGKGYATEAMHAILNWGEAHFGNARTVCLVDPENTPSLRLADKLGFQEEARTTFRDHPTIILGRGSSA